MRIGFGGGVNVDEFLQNGDLGSEEDNVVRRFLEELLGFPFSVERRDELFQRLQFFRHGGVGRSSVAGAALAGGSPAAGSSSGLSHWQVAGARHRRPRPHLLGLISPIGSQMAEWNAAEKRREREREKTKKKKKWAFAIIFFSEILRGVIIRGEAKRRVLEGLSKSVMESSTSATTFSWNHHYAIITPFLIFLFFIIQYTELIDY